MEEWVNQILADPITKLHKEAIKFKKIDNLIDARIYLKNTFGWEKWLMGQNFYEQWLENGEISILKKETNFKKVKELEKPVYDSLSIKGRVLDIGGGVGTLREFLDNQCNYLCVDPHYKSLKNIPQKKIDIFKCLKESINFIVGFAEFLPLKDSSFDFVHMRSMLDHVQIPDLVILEANRVLKKNGKLIVGMTIDRGKNGKFIIKDYIKNLLRELLYHLGMRSFRDYHTWHPTLKNLKKVINDNGFVIEKTIWQPGMDDRVVYIQAIKSNID